MDELAEEVKNELEEFGVSIGQNPERIFKKSASLCNKYNIKSDEFVESWLAFAASNSLQEVNEANLEKLEKQELAVKFKKDDEVKFLPAPSLNLETSGSAEVRIYGKGAVGDEDVEDYENEMETDDVLQAYGGGAGTPKLKKLEAINSKQKTKLIDSVKTEFSPNTYSNSAQANSVSYAARSKAGDSIVRYKCKDSEYWTEVLNTATEPIPVSAVQCTKDMLSGPTVKFMHQKTTSLATIFDDVITEFGLAMLADEDRDLQDLRVSTVEECWYLGRIRNDDGRLSQGSCFLEGELEISGGHIVSLDLTDVEEYRLFPGQVLLVKGKNELGKCLRATEIIVPTPTPMPSIEPNKTCPINITVACGPYTPTDSLKSEPLLDLIKVIKQDKPHVCILMGPFIDPSHPMIAAGDVADTFDEMFEKIVEILKDSLKDLNTHLVLIPSYKDAHHFNVFPTLKYCDVGETKKFSLFPDPALFEIAGITFGVTATDILRHLSTSEVSKSTITDRMGGLSKLVLSQRSFYPLYPPDDSVPLDVNLWKNYGRFNSTPHILIVPSDLRCFIKDIEGTIVVNPERLTKGKSGGSYARLQVKFPDTVVDDVESIADFCCGEIVKI